MASDIVNGASAKRASMETAGSPISGMGKLRAHAHTCARPRAPNCAVTPGPIRIADVSPLADLVLAFFFDLHG
jgi:hypothetical protein